MYSEIKKFINDSNINELENILKFIIKNIKSTRKKYYIYLFINIFLFINLSLFATFYITDIINNFLVYLIISMSILICIINNIIKIYKLNFLKYEIKRYVLYYNKILNRDGDDIKDSLTKLFINVLHTLTSYSDISRHNLFTIISRHDKEEFKQVLV